MIDQQQEGELTANTVRDGTVKLSTKNIQQILNVLFQKEPQKD